MKIYDHLFIPFLIFSLPPYIRVTLIFSFDNIEIFRNLSVSFGFFYINCCIMSPVVPSFFVYCPYTQILNLFHHIENPVILEYLS